MCFVLGLVGVAVNPALYYGVAGLVLGAIGGCGVLLGLGSSFVGLVLLLIYLGGMLVVFAYSVAMAADPHPTAWGEGTALVYAVGYIILFSILGGCVAKSRGLYGALVGEGGSFYCMRADFGGITLLYSSGGGMLLLCGCSLLVALFVVLELSRGGLRGGLRAP